MFLWCFNCTSQGKIICEVESKVIQFLMLPVTAERVEASGERENLLEVLKEGKRIKKRKKEKQNRNEMCWNDVTAFVDAWKRWGRGRGGRGRGKEEGESRGRGEEEGGSRGKGEFAEPVIVPDATTITGKRT